MSRAGGWTGGRDSQDGVESWELWVATVAGVGWCTQHTDRAANDPSVFTIRERGHWRPNFMSTYRVLGTCLACVLNVGPTVIVKTALALVSKWFLIPPLKCILCSGPVIFQYSIPGSHYNPFAITFMAWNYPGVTINVQK